MRLHRNQYVTRCAAGICILAAVGYFLFVNYAGSRRVENKTININYRFSVRNNTSAAVRNAGLVAGIPLSGTAVQGAVNASANHPYALIQDGTGNNQLKLHWDLIPPYSTKIIVVTTAVDRNGADEWAGPMPSGAFLKAEPLLECDHPLITKTALKHKTKTREDTVRNTFAWVSENIRYAGYVKKTRGALYALKYRKGDCTEYAALFVALCRANDIPARIVGGFVSAGSAALDLGDYHNWAQFYHDGRWHTADPQRGVFMNDPESNDYIVFKIITPSRHDSGALVTGIKGDGLKLLGNI